MLRLGEDHLVRGRPGRRPDVRVDEVEALVLDALEQARARRGPHRRPRAGYQPSHRRAPASLDGRLHPRVPQGRLQYRGAAEAADGPRGIAALRGLETALRAAQTASLDPLRFLYDAVSALAAWADGDAEAAIGFAQQSLQRNPRYMPAWRTLVAAQVEGASELVLVDFGATWCGPCRMMEPTIEALATEYAGRVKVATVDADTNLQAVTRYNVRSLPTFLFFKGGQVVDQVIGAVPRPLLERKIQEHV